MQKSQSSVQNSGGTAQISEAPFGLSAQKPVWGVVCLHMTTHTGNGGEDSSSRDKHFVN